MFSAPDFFKNIESPTLTQLLAQVIIHLYSEEVEKLRKGKAATDKMPTPEHSEPLGIYLPHLPRLPPKGIAATSIACLASVEKFEAFDDSVAAWDPCDLDHGCYKVTKSCFFFYAGRMKRDHRADTMEGCGSKAGPGSRDRDGIPPRPGLREASKRLTRIHNALCHDKGKDLQAELGNFGHENWTPLEWPDWLLLEIDSDILIRREQVDVAHAIIAPESRDNTVLQLNMGKGKTSCIVPMALAAIGNGKQLSRLIVPEPLLLPTAQMIQSRLGGLVGREIRHIPFSRKTSIDSQTLRFYRNLIRRCWKAGALC
ncbi:uncharacterized protein AALT_g12004 [Alternaria alternata]|nr:uncharacterized protein AALT_g12043 [Alternaria alternata]OWY56618.1 uncharacterized protein AALT_g12004 [Alternaria alternata]